LGGVTHRQYDRFVNVTTPTIQSLSPFAARLAVVAALVAAVVAGCAGASRSVAPSAAPSTEPDLLVYFLDQTRYATAVPPYEVMVRRPAVGVSSIEERATATIRAVFAGPTPDERAQGLTAVTSGFTAVRELRLIDAVAHVYLEGTCTGGGATYTVANLLSANLLPFPEIEWVKVYDEHGETEDPTGPRDSIPACLEP
jgi:hypothetical protein